MQNERVLVVVKDEAVRQSLQAVLRDRLSGHEFLWVKDIESAVFNIEKEQTFKYIFLQLLAPHPEILRFIHTVKKYEALSPSKKILLVPEDIASEDLLSQYLSLGFSGVLVEPISIESIDEVLNLSQRLMLGGSIARLTVAAGLQFKAHLIKDKKMKEGGGLLQSVMEACKIFETENPGQTVHSVAKDLSSLSLEDRLKVNISTMYSGVSERVRKLVDMSLQKDKS